jgi:glycopeptide antibiotics resistance protein
MKRIFLWFYCLPIPSAVLLLAMTTVAFLYLREKFSNTRRWKVGIPILFICWIAVILLGTLGQRTTDGNTAAPILTPFHSYYLALNGGNVEIYRTNFMNVVLFYPAGLLGCSLLPQRWHPFIKALLLITLLAPLSIWIEYTQYHHGLGLAETDDVIHNTLGTLLGVLACDTLAARIKLLLHRSK